VTTVTRPTHLLVTRRPQPPIRTDQRRLLLQLPPLAPRGGCGCGGCAAAATLSSGARVGVEADHCGGAPGCLDLCVGAMMGPVGVSTMRVHKQQVLGRHALQLAVEQELAC